MTQLPIACTLSSAELRTRRAGLLPGLAARANERLAVPNGCRWQFSPTDDLLAALTAMIASERQCCRFLRFAVTLEADHGPIYLEVTGPPGTREFLERLVGGAAGSR